MYPSLDACFHPSHQLLVYTGGLGLLPRHPQDALRHEFLPRFSHPDWPDPWLPILCYHPFTN